MKKGTVPFSRLWAKRCVNSLTGHEDNPSPYMVGAAQRELTCRDRLDRRLQLPAVAGWGLKLPHAVVVTFTKYL